MVAIIWSSAPYVVSINYAYVTIIKAPRNYKESLLLHNTTYTLYIIIYGASDKWVPKRLTENVTVSAEHSLGIVILARHFYVPQVITYRYTLSIFDTLEHQKTVYGIDSQWILQISQIKCWAGRRLRTQFSVVRGIKTWCHPVFVFLSHPRLFDSLVLYVFMKRNELSTRGDSVAIISDNKFLVTSKIPLAC